MGNKVEKGLRSPLLDQSEEKITVSHIYKLNANDLQKMFSPSKKESLKFLMDHKGDKGVLQKCSSDARTGIVGDEKDLSRRKKHFGDNAKPLADPPKLLDSIKQILHEPIWKALAVSAILGSIFECYAIGITGLGEGIAIIFTTLMLICITSGADFIKDKRFIQLQSLIKDENIPVIRGKQGSSQSVSVWSLVVGDVILLETGARVPADCLLIEGADLRVSRDESAGENQHDDLSQPKTVMDGRNQNPDPFIFSGSKVIRGTGKAMVCCVGTQSSSNKEETQAMGVNEDTPLQKKLNNLEGTFTLFALYAAVVILVFFSIRLVLEVYLLELPSEEEQTNVAVTQCQEINANAENIDVLCNPGTQDFMDKYLELLPSKTAIALKKATALANIIIILIVVSIPEGLPLTIGISLAFSVMKMYKEGILVRKLDAPEKMGGIQEICCSKTATLTKNEMKIKQFYCENRLIINNRKDTLTQCDLRQETLMRVQECILNNCDARVEMDESVYKAVGNGTEVGLLNFLQNADIPIHLLINKKLGHVLMRSPHTPENKRASIAVQSPDGQFVSIYVTGAPEMLIDLCSTVLTNENTAELGQDERQKISNHISNMAMQPLRVIGMAYLELTMAQWQQNFQADGIDSNASAIFEEKLTKRQQFLTWIGAFGMRDPYRKDVAESIRYARDDAQLNIRMISGDHIETAKAVAIKTGILRDKESQYSDSVMEGADFRALVGDPLYEKKNELTAELEPTDELQNMAEFDRVIGELKVLARATPLDKEILIRGLRFRNRAVAVTGDGISDVGCLSMANIGLAMGSGCSASKQASDLVLTDDDFESNIQAIMWGRNIFLNVSRFLQFQVTVNFSCLFTVLIGGLMIGESPFNAVQLLWVNLIMDTLAAIALSTEPPIKAVTQGPPIKPNAQVMTPAVWKQVIGMSVWNVIVMTAMFAKMVLNEKYIGYVLVDTDGGQYAENGLYKREQLTMIYNTFIFLQLFNQINCRKVGGKDFNVVESFTHNWYFLGILVGSFSFQIFFCTKLSFISDTEPMDRPTWGACMAIGSSSILVSMLLKLLPKGYTDKVGDKIPKMVDEDQVVESKVLNTYKKAAAAPQAGEKVVADNKSDEDFGNKNEPVDDVGNEEFQNI